MPTLLLHSTNFLLRLASGVADADELMAALVEGEESNFGLFNYVNELSAEVDKLEDGIGSLRWVVA